MGMRRGHHVDDPFVPPMIMVARNEWTIGQAIRAIWAARRPEAETRNQYAKNCAAYQRAVKHGRGNG